MTLRNPEVQMVQRGGFQFDQDVARLDLRVGHVGKAAVFQSGRKGGEGFHEGGGGGRRFLLFPCFG